MGLIVPCLFQYKNDRISKLAVGKPKRKKRRWVFSEDTQLSCRTCQQDAVDAESSHQGEIG